MCSANLTLLLRAVIYFDRRARQSAILYDCCSQTHMHHQHLILFEPLNTQSLASRSSISHPYRLATQPRSTATSWHALTLLPALQRLVQCSTDISPASSLRQEPKSSHITIPHHQFKPPKTFSVPSSKLKNKNPPPKAVSYLQINSALQPDRHPACR